MCMNKFMYVFYVPPGKNGRTLCFWVVRPSVCHTLQVPIYVQRPANAMPFQQMCVLQCPHDVDVHLLFVLILITFCLCEICSRYVQLFTGQICCPDTTQDRVDIGYGDQCCGSIPYSGGGAQICCDGKIVETSFETMDMVDICFFLARMPEICI